MNTAAKHTEVIVSPHSSEQMKSMANPTRKIGAAILFNLVAFIALAATTKIDHLGDIPWISKVIGVVVVYYLFALGDLVILGFISIFPAARRHPFETRLCWTFVFSGSWNWMAILLDL